MGANNFLALSKNTLFFSVHSIGMRRIAGGMGGGESRTMQTQHHDVYQPSAHIYIYTHTHTHMQSSKISIEVFVQIFF